uniref:DUF1534 domain-containing protein n=1 Tax=Steinernema glaseri TaxID=37863 RepID=A0A1I7ZUS0_9BILA
MTQIQFNDSASVSARRAQGNLGAVRRKDPSACEFYVVALVGKRPFLTTKGNHPPCKPHSPGSIIPFDLVRGCASTHIEQPSSTLINKKTWKGTTPT